MKNKLITLIASLALLAGIASAQTVITSTTIATAVTSLTATSIVVTSATGFTAGTTMAWSDDGEAFCNVAVSSTTISVQRGCFGTPVQTHKALSRIWVGPYAAFYQTTPQGQCTKTTLLYVPYINIRTGEISNCMGLTTAGHWLLVNRPGVGLVGADIASATSIIPSGTFFIVSGTTAIATITVPEGWAPGMSIDINPTGVFATTTAGNIGLVSSASVVGRILRMTWDGTKWWPSYVS